MEERTAKLRLVVCGFFVIVLPSVCGLFYAITLIGRGRSTEIGFSVSAVTPARAQRTSLRMADGYFCYGTSAVEARRFRQAVVPLAFSASATQLGHVVPSNAFLRVDNGNVGRPFFVPMAPVEALAQSLCDSVDRQNIPIGSQWGRFVNLSTHFIYFAGYLPLLLSLPPLLLALTAWPRKRPGENARRGFELVAALPRAGPAVVNPNPEIRRVLEPQVANLNRSEQTQADPMRPAAPAADD